MTARKTTSPASSHLPVRLEITDTLALPPHIAQEPRPWEPRAVKPSPAPAPFDQAQAIERISQHLKFDRDRWNWQAVELPIVMTPTEALFWLEAFDQAQALLPQPQQSPLFRRNVQPIKEQLAAALADFTPTPLSADQVLEKACRAWGGASGRIAVVLATLVPLERFAEVFDFPSSSSQPYQTYMNGLIDAVQSFCDDVVPYRSDAQLDALRAALEPMVATMDWNDYERCDCLIQLAASLHMGQAIATIATNLVDDQGYWPLVWLTISNLPSPEAMVAASQRIKLILDSPERIWRWLHWTGTRNLEPIRASILATKYKPHCARLIQAAGCVRSPAMAALMLDFVEHSASPVTAQAWLAEEVGNAIAALVPIAADGKHKLAGAAVRYLKAQRKLGRAALIESHLAQLSAAQVERIRKLVLEVQERVYPTHDATSLPTDLAHPLSTPLPRAFKCPDWLSLPHLSPLLIGEKRLADEQVLALLAQLITHKPDGFPAIIDRLKAHVQPRVLETFALDIFEQFRTSREWGVKVRWVWALLVAVGADETALRLGEYARSLLAAKRTPRAKYVVTIIAGLPNDSALVQLDRIRQVAKSPSIKQYITELLTVIAKAQKLTLEQLSDRIVPTLDLDQRGTRTFDFGPRQFRFVLTSDLKAAVIDPAGKVRTELPRANRGDDPDLAAAAHREWKKLKGLLRDSLGLQLQRLESAMIDQRWWLLAEFMRYLVEHPLMTHLTQRLVWSLLTANGQLITHFRLTSERTFSDAEDNTITLAAGSRVRLLHPLQLTESQREQWLTLLADYEIVQPFPQLSRPVYRCEPSQARDTTITRFGTFSVAAGSLIALTRSGHWHELSAYTNPARIARAYPGQGVLAVLEFTPGYHNYSQGQIDYEAPQTLEPLRFRPLSAKKADSLLNVNGQLVGLPLGRVPAIAFSEACYDLANLWAKRLDTEEV
jgi:hypothetical protein